MLNEFSKRVLLKLLLSLATLVSGVSSAQDSKVEQDHAAKMAAGLKLFKSQIKPVLIGRCLKCHGGKEIEGELDLSNRKSLLAGGTSGPSINLKNAETSLLYRMITHQEEPFMPEDGAKLDQRHIAAFAKWISLGAPYDQPLAKQSVDPLAWTQKNIEPSAKEFWSFQPLTEPTVPQFKNDRWSKTDIDRFVMDQLQRRGLTPNPQVNRFQLVRRMYLAVTGLPPTPKQVSDFIQDKSPDAVNQLIDRLLESQHFGEKWARHWLDIARFAESHGFEQDYNRPHAYHYRDFVIQAFNNDMPFDQFVRWQIAGDEIAPSEPLALMATGFLGAGVFPTQLTEKEFEPARYDELDDMASTIGTAMLGITIGCARCHDHKFDPIPQRDYYRFVSTFTTTIRSEIELELEPDSIAKQLDKWKQEKQKQEKELADYEKNQLATRFENWLKSRPESKAVEPTWIVLDFDKAISHGGAKFEKLADGSLRATGKNPEFDRYEFVTTTQLQGLTAIRIEALADDSLVRKGPGRASNGNFALGNLTITSQPAGQETPVKVDLVRPRATFQQNQGNLSIASSIDNNLKTGWAVDPQFGKDHASIFEFSKPVGDGQPTTLRIEMKFDVNNRHSIGRPRISVTHSRQPVGFHEDSGQQAVLEVFEIMKKSNGKLDESQRQLLFNWFRKSDEEWRKLNDRIQSHVASRPQPRKTKVMISSEGVKPLKHHADGRKFPHFYPQTHFLRRGDTTQKQGVAKPGFLQVFLKGKDVADYQVKKPGDSRLSYRRTALANWLTDSKTGPGHLLARVIVNRIWQHYFGRGIVSTSNDFGFQGQRPTHPELLDWLAQKLLDNNWSLKAIHREILQSAVYQQSSEFNEQDSRVDIENRLLWRFSPRRLDAEIIRDSMLAVSGTLDSKMFGPGSLDEKMDRRSIYFMIKRSKLIPMMQIFDTPEPLVSVGSRPSTTVAPQALLLMNNPNVRRYSQNFAQRILARAENQSGVNRLHQVVGSGFQMALARQPTNTELQKNVSFIQRQMDSYQTDGKPNAIELAVTDFCQILFCLNEFVYVD